MRTLWKSLLVAALAVAALAGPAAPAHAVTWHGWVSLGLPYNVSRISNPAAVSWGWGHLDVFVIGELSTNPSPQDEAVWHRWFFDGVGWSGWTRMDNPPNVWFAYHPAAVSWGSGRIDLFAVGSDHALWHRFFDGAWHAWESRGGYLTSAPTATSIGSGQLDVFASGLDYQMWQLSFRDGAWADDWVPRAGHLASAPAAVSTVGWPGGLTTTYALGPDRKLRSAHGVSGQWGPWQEHTYPPITVVGGGPSAYLFEGTFHHLVIESGGVKRCDHTSCESLGYPTSVRGGDTVPSAASWGPGRIDVFTVPGEREWNHSLWHKWRN